MSLLRLGLEQVDISILEDRDDTVLEEHPGTRDTQKQPQVGERVPKYLTNTPYVYMDQVSPEDKVPLEMEIVLYLYIIYKYIR